MSMKSSKTANSMIKPRRRWSRWLGTESQPKIQETERRLTSVNLKISRSILQKKIRKWTKRTLISWKKSKSLRKLTLEPSKKTRSSKRVWILFVTSVEEAKINPQKMIRPKTILTKPSLSPAPTWPVSIAMAIRACSNSLLLLPLFSLALSSMVTALRELLVLSQIFKITLIISEMVKDFSRKIMRKSSVNSKRKSRSLVPRYQRMNLISNPRGLSLLKI